MKSKKKVVKAVKGKGQGKAKAKVGRRAPVKVKVRVAGRGRVMDRHLVTALNNSTSVLADWAMADPHPNQRSPYVGEEEMDDAHEEALGMEFRRRLAAATALRHSNPSPSPSPYTSAVRVEDGRVVRDRY